MVLACTSGLGGGPGRPIMFNVDSRCVFYLQDLNFDFNFSLLSSQPSGFFSCMMMKAKAFKRGITV